MNSPAHSFGFSAGPFPPLPDDLPPLDPQTPAPASTADDLQPIPFPRPPIQLRSLRCGAYLVNYSPSGSSLVTYDGTLRVECHNAGRTASGDLYQRPVIFLPNPGFPPRPPRPVLLPGPNPAAGIPILPRGQYRYYLRVTQILERFTFGSSFTLGFELWRFTKSTGPWSAGGTWTNEGAFSARMTWQAAPAGYPSAHDYLAGDVTNSSGVVTGRMTMGWVSAYLRKATVEIDRVPQSEPALDNGAGLHWNAIGDSVGWDITVDQSDANVAEPSGEFWSDAEAHAAMLARRAAANLDAEWRYHVLCVRRLDSTERGIMYDAYGGDSNNVPREGCVISTHWTIPNTPNYGTVQGMRFGAATGPYFRTAIHEIGHAMGLYHNTIDNGFMNTTNLIADNSLAPGSPAFPNNVLWAYNADDAKRLRHMPDVYVRPGGTPFGTSYSSTPISPTDFEVEAAGLELRVAPLLAAVPVGAPVRVNLELANVTGEPMLAPSDIGLKGGFVKGTVIDPTGVARTFSPLLLCVDEQPLTPLQPQESVTNSLTLLRGGQGALFPLPGAYEIEVEAHWDSGEGMEAVVAGKAHVMVTGAVDEAHAEAALKILASPDALLTLVLGGDHLPEGIAAIQAALANPVLRPHYAYIEAKRVGQRFGKRKANVSAAAKLIEPSTVMSPAEIKRAAKIVKDEAPEGAAAKSIAKTLKTKVADLQVGNGVKDLVNSL